MKRIDKKNYLWVSPLLKRVFRKFGRKSYGLKPAHFLTFWLILKLSEFPQKLLCQIGD